MDGRNMQAVCADAIADNGGQLRLPATRFGVQDARELIALFESADAPPLVTLDVELRGAPIAAEQLIRSLPLTVRSLRIDMTGVSNDSLLTKCMAALVQSEISVEELAIHGGPTTGAWLKELFVDEKEKIIKRTEPDGATPMQLQMAFEEEAVVVEPYRPPCMKLTSLRCITLSHCAVLRGKMQSVLEDLAKLATCGCLEELTLESMKITGNMLKQNNHVSNRWSLISAASTYLLRFSLCGNAIGKARCITNDGFRIHPSKQKSKASHKGEQCLSLRNTQLQDAAELSSLFGSKWSTHPHPPSWTTLDIRDNEIGLPAAENLVAAIKQGPAYVQHILVSEPYGFVAKALHRRRATRLMGLFRAITVLDGKLWNARKKKAEEQYHLKRLKAEGNFAEGLADE